MTNEKRKILNGTLRYVFLIIMALFVLVPVLWMVSTAFKTEAETYSPTPIWIPSEISLASFKKFFGIYNFGSMTMNSLVTCLGSMIICTVFSCLAGYGVTRFNFKGKKSFLGFLLVTQMFPSVMLVVPFYSISYDQYFVWFDHCLCCNKYCVQYLDDDFLFQNNSNGA